MSVCSEKHHFWQALLPWGSRGWVLKWVGYISASGYHGTDASPLVIGAFESVYPLLPQVQGECH